MAYSKKSTNRNKLISVEKKAKQNKTNVFSYVYRLHAEKRFIIFRVCRMFFTSREVNNINVVTDGRYGRLNPDKFHNSIYCNL